MAIPSNAEHGSHLKFACFPCNYFCVSGLNGRGGPCSGNRLNKPYGDARAAFYFAAQQAHRR